MFFICSKAFPLLHRCIPVDLGCYAEFAQGFITFVSDNTVLRRVIAGVMASKEIIMGLCVLALGITQLCLVHYMQIYLLFCNFFCCSRCTTLIAQRIQ